MTQPPQLPALARAVDGQGTGAVPVPQPLQPLLDLGGRDRLVVDPGRHAHGRTSRRTAAAYWARPNHMTFGISQE